MLTLYRRIRRWWRLRRAVPPTWTIDIHCSPCDRSFFFSVGMAVDTHRGVGFITSIDHGTGLLRVGVWPGKHGEPLLSPREP